MHCSTSGSCENLDFDVAWFLEEFFYVEFRVSESRVRLRSSRLETLLEILDGFCDSHPSAASAKRSLHKNGESNLLSLSLRLLDGFNLPVSARDDWDSRAFHE